MLVPEGFSGLLPLGARIYCLGLCLLPPASIWCGFQQELQAGLLLLCSANIVFQKVARQDVSVLPEVHTRGCSWVTGEGQTAAVDSQFAALQEVSRLRKSLKA